MRKHAQCARFGEEYTVTTSKGWQSTRYRHTVLVGPSGGEQLYCYCIGQELGELTEINFD